MKIYSQLNSKSLMKYKNKQANTNFIMMQMLLVNLIKEFKNY